MDLLWQDHPRCEPWRETVRRLRGGAAALALAAVALAGCAQQPEAAPAAPPPAPVRTMTMKPVPLPETSDYLATLKSRNSTALNPQVEGYVTEIYVRSGDRVAAGAPILQIDPLRQQAVVESQQAALAAQRANVEYAQQQWNRIRQLYEAGVVSREERDQARAALDAASEQLKSLEEQVAAQRVELQYYRVNAPVGGIVGDIPVRVGDRVTNSTLLTTIDQPGALELYVNVPVERAADLRTGLPVQLLDSAGNVQAESRIDFVSPSVDTATQSVLAKATFPNRSGTLRTSQYARARIVWRVRETLALPVLTPTRITGQFFVFVVEGEGEAAVARQRLVQLGEVTGNQYPVLSGLQAGDRVIVEGAQFLFDGARVAEMPAGEGAPAAN